MKYLHIIAVHIYRRVQQKTLLLELHLHFQGQNIHGKSVKLLHD